MSVLAPPSWYARSGGDTDIATPTFLGYNGQHCDSPSDASALALALRSAFAFFRRHGDRRYSAQSLMRLLTFADKIDAGDHTELPSIVTAEVPFAYDEETEVKSGGVLGIAVVLPDGRVMLAVHADKRRTKLGKALLSFVTSYFHSYPQVWVHRGNTIGAQFCLSMGYMPWLINPSGAVQYATMPTQPPTDDAVNEEPDFLVDEALAQRRNSGRPQAARHPQVERAIQRHRNATAMPALAMAESNEPVRARLSEDFLAALGRDIQDAVVEPDDEEWFVAEPETPVGYHRVVREDRENA